MTPFSFINDQLCDIDKQIASSKFVSARNSINGVLSVVPGVRIGDLPNSGEVHWRKLLAEVGCKNDMELLTKGSPLRRYSAFECASRYASEKETPVYSSIEEKKTLILAELVSELKRQERDSIRKTKAVKLLDEYRNDLDAFTKRTQEGVAQLEACDKAILEQQADYQTVVGEYGHCIDAICSEVKSSKQDANDITIECRDTWIAELEAWQSLCNQEEKDLKKTASTCEYYNNYQKLTEKQKTVISDINNDLLKISRLRSRVDNLLSIIEQIKAEYSSVLSALQEGDYSLAKNILTQPHFDGIVKKVLLSNPRQRGAS